MNQNSIPFPLCGMAIIFIFLSTCSAQCELDNLTWYDVQKKLRDVQRDQQMCIHKPDLTELDIYHRILRYQGIINCYNYYYGIRSNEIEF